MNKTKVFGLLFLGVILPMKAQIYTPSAIIQGNSGNDNVGIGTTTPAAKLHINNAGTSGQLDYNLIVQKTMVADNNRSAVGLLLSTECCGPFGKSAIVHERTGGYGLGSLHFLNSSAFDTSIPTLLDAKMTINSNGNVGIGTINPDSKLVLSGPLGANIGTGGAAIKMINSDTNNYSSISAGIVGYSNSGIDFSCDGTRRMVIDGYGNIGVGITNPTNKLDVNGTIHSKEVKVDMNGWSDFVFKREYNLPRLEEVEKQINEKGHLANIPNEEEVLKNGINLGEMNAKLLQKIEELTLYTIEQEKKNNIQSKQIEALEKENRSFKSLSERLSKLEKQSK